MAWVRNVHGEVIEIPDEELAVVEPPARRAITSLQFMERMSQERRIAIRAAARNNPELEDWLDILRAAQEVDLDDPRTKGGVAAMQAAGLLTAEEVAVLLS